VVADADAAAARAAAASAAAVANRRGIGAVAAAATDVRRNTTKYADSVESVYRHVIQKQKNDMASEIIDAGRFDQNTTNEERKETLEQILADADRNRVAKNEVPTWHWIHRRLARGEHELEEFELIDSQMHWFPPTDLEHVPAWVRFTAEDVQAAVPERKRRRGELEDPVMVGSAWGAQDSLAGMVAVCSMAARLGTSQPSARMHLLRQRTALTFAPSTSVGAQHGWPGGYRVSWRFSHRPGQPSPASSTPQHPPAHRHT